MSILTINGLGVDPNSITYGIQDVSAPDAGRDLTGLMHKMTVTQKRTIQLEWWQTDPALTAQILTAVKPEYFNVTYPDPESNSNVTKTFYVGDRSTPVQVWGSGVGNKRYSKLSFKLIER